MYIKIAFNNLIRQRQRTILLIAAIAIGFAVVVLVEGLFSGYIDSYQYKIAKSEGGHVYISRRADSLSLPVTVMLESGVHKSGVKVSYANKIVDAHAEILIDGNFFGFNFIGVSPEDKFIRDTLIFDEGSWEDIKTENAITILNREKRVEARSSTEKQKQEKMPDTIQVSVKNGLIVPDLIAEEFGLKIGDKVLVKMFNHFIKVDDVNEFFIAATYKASESYGSNIYVDKSYLLEVKGFREDRIDTYAIFLENPANQEELANKIEETLRGKSAVGPALTSRSLAKKRNPHNPMKDIYLQTKEIRQQYRIWNPYIVSTLEDSKPAILNSPRRMNRISFSVLAFILLIVMLGISNAFKIIINSRMHEIGTMRAFGTEAGQIKFMIILEASLLAVAGVIIGFTLGLIILFTISAIPISPLSVLYRFTRSGKMIWQLSAYSLIPKVFLTIFFVNLAVFFPVRKAVNRIPADCMREI